MADINRPYGWATAVVQCSAISRDGNAGRWGGGIQGGELSGLVAPNLVDFAPVIVRDCKTWTAVIVSEALAAC